VARRGENLPGFKARQLAFSAHIRDPDEHAGPADVPERRMRVYRELFYNNIEGFLASAFPVAKRVLAGERWHRLVRAFISRHPSRSPYFLEISQEFLTYLGAADAADAADLPPFLLELCHYEWVELWLSVAEEDPPEEGIDPAGDLLTGVPVVSPLIWKLAYRYPVHRIGPDHQPTEPGPEPTQLLVYRRRDDTVHFMEINALTMALLDALDGAAAGSLVLEDLAARVPVLDEAVIREKGLATMERLRKADVILGTKHGSGGLAR
jgi:uncharacterized protein